MGKYHLNLSTRPFPAYRVASFIMLAVFLILVALSLGQVYGYFEYTRLANDIKGKERDLKAETTRLTAQEAALRAQLGGALAKDKITEVNYINTLIKKRNFCWTCLLRHIETRIPINVHLTSLKPEVGKDGNIVLSINAQGRSLGDLADFIDRLQNSQVFEKVNVAYEDVSAEKSSIVMTVPYYPEREKEGAPPSQKKGD